MPQDSARVLLAICLAAASWSFSFGVGTQAISHWLKAWLGPGQDLTIGLNFSTYYLGIGLTSLAVPRLINRFGNGCTAFGMLLSGLSLAAFPWADDLATWFVLRFVNGAAGAMSLVPLETMVSRGSPKNARARRFSFYALALTLGGALGLWAGNHYYEATSRVVFLLGGICPIAASLVLAWMPSSVAANIHEITLQAPASGSQRFLSYATAWFQGFLEGGLLAFLSIYLIALGMSQDDAGTLMGLTMAGVIVFQVPVGWLADGMGRLPVLLGCYGVVAGGLILLPILSTSIWLALCLFLLGACAGSLYPLGLALLGDRVGEVELTRVYAWFMAMECVGSLMGPPLMGEARVRWGQASMFVVALIGLLLVMLAWTILLVHQRKRAPE